MRFFGRYHGNSCPLPGQQITLDPYDGFFDLASNDTPEEFLITWEPPVQLRQSPGEAVRVARESEIDAILALSLVRCQRISAQPDICVRVAATSSVADFVATSQSAEDDTKGWIAGLAAAPPSELGVWGQPVFWVAEKMVQQARELRPGSALLLYPFRSSPGSALVVMVLRQAERLDILTLGAFEPESSSVYSISCAVEPRLRNELRMDPLGVEVLRALEEGADFEGLVALLRAKRREGLQQGDAVESLENLRGSVSPEQEDLVLDLMDAVVGWCHPSYWIWEQPYPPRRDG